MIGITDKESFSAAAMVLTFALFVPYLRGILRGTIRPRVFSWVIWGLATFTVFLAQLAEHYSLTTTLFPVAVGAAFVVVAVLLLARRRRHPLSVREVS